MQNLEASQPKEKQNKQPCCLFKDGKEKTQIESVQLAKAKQAVRKCVLELKILDHFQSLLAVSISNQETMNSSSSKRSSQDPYKTTISKLLWKKMTQLNLFQSWSLCSVALKVPTKEGWLTGLSELLLWHYTFFYTIPKGQNFSYQTVSITKGLGMESLPFSILMAPGVGEKGQILHLLICFLTLTWQTHFSHLALRTKRGLLTHSSLLFN